MHFTQNPIGSDDQLDLQDNAISFDYAMNSPAALWQDRFGKQHKTVQQALKDVGFKPAGFDFVSGGTLGIGDRDKCVFYPTDGYWYSWNGKLPYVVPANSSPTPGGKKGWGVVTRDERVVTREALRRTYLEAGLNLVEGSFEAGGVLTNQNDVLLHESSGKAFSGPVGTVPAGTNPAGGGFVDRSIIISKTYDTVTDMISAGSQHVVGQKVQWSGYHTVADGGGNWGVVKAGTHVHDGGKIFTITPTLYIDADLGDKAVSVRMFGAVGDWTGGQTVPGSGTDDTPSIQNAFNYCISTATELHFPSGRYRTTSPLLIDRSFNREDPINGGMFGITLKGGGVASSQIVADHNDPCISYLGGLSAGLHSYFYIDGLGLLKGNYAKNAGSVGLKFDQIAFFQVQRFDIYGFEYGIDGVDVLSGTFMDGTIRGNEHGWRFKKGTRSHPNNISFRGVNTLNNRTTGGTLIKPAVFNYNGGSIESNGYTGILADPNSWGLYVESAGTEGSVGINMQGVYIENNNGKADVWILQTTNTVIHNFNGCSFLRFSDTRYVTSCILFNSINDSRISLGGCGFKDYTPYVSDPSRLWIGAGNAQVFDAGGNVFFDTTGGFVGLARAVFAPIASNHQLPFASLPAASKFRNAIQYCADGTGTNQPALAVSDGVKWWQIPLGQFAGSVSSSGVALALPHGWTCSRTGNGDYVITHNLNLPTNSYAVVAIPKGAIGTGHCTGWVLSGNSFTIYFANMAGVATDMDFSFMLSVI